MSLVLLQPGVNRTARLPNVDLTGPTEDALYFRCLQSQVVLDRQKETRHFSWERGPQTWYCVETAPCWCGWISTRHKAVKRLNLAICRAGQPSGEGWRPYEFACRCSRSAWKCLPGTPTPTASQWELKPTLPFPICFPYNPKFPASRLLGLPPAFTLAYFSAYSTLKMEAICSSEMSVGFQLNIQRYIPEDSTLHNHWCENLKPYTWLLLLVSLSFCYMHPNLR
jgi:hypothetical protein